jgi:parvulin-like peptidyl-prolyl isomerase
VFNLYCKIYYLLIISFLLWIFSCGVAPKEEDAVITIGETVITKKKLQHEIERIKYDMGLSAEEIREGIDSIINNIVEKNLILEYGRVNAITITEEELKTAVNEVKQDYPGDLLNEVLLKRYIDINEWKKNLHNELLVKKIVDTALADVKMATLDEVKAYYDSHLEDFREPLMLEIRQIVTKTGEEMENLLSRLIKGEDMAELARNFSIAPESENEGLLGWFAKGELEENIEKSVFALKPGEMSKIIESPYGFHIFKVVSVKEEGIRGLPESIKDIESIITMENRELMYTKWLDGLKMQFPVSIKEMEILADMKMED